MENGSDIDLCLFVEPSCEDYWMKPGEAFTVHSAAEGIDVWFETRVSKGCVIVWLYEDGDPYKVVGEHRVVDENGTSLNSGHQRPAGQRWTAGGPIID
ncbi:hypothetical protein [Streptomyces sp. NPDC093795]|uniref:hypothetical protein n=1 Tax=Streptomyces sp. NPDC093795 TaxID=3366051 RepID=UPI0038262692